MLCVTSESNRRDQNCKEKEFHVFAFILTMAQWLVQRSESVNITQRMNDIDSTSTCTRSYDFGRSTLKSKFTFTKLLYMEVAGHYRGWK